MLKNLEDMAAQNDLLRGIGSGQNRKAHQLVKKTDMTNCQTLSLDLKPQPGLR